MTQTELKNGKELRFSNKEPRTAESSYNTKLKKFCIWFNGQLFPYKTFTGMNNKLSQLTKDFNLKAVK